MSLEFFKTSLPFNFDLSSVEVKKKYTINECLSEMDKNINLLYSFVANSLQTGEGNNNRVKLEYSFFSPFLKLTTEATKKTSPLMTILYKITDSEKTNGFIFSDIETEKYKYKDLDKQTAIQYFALENDLLVVLRGGYYGFLDNTYKSIYLKVNVWQQGVDNINIYLPSKMDENITPVVFTPKNVVVQTKDNSQVERILYGNTTEKDKRDIFCLFSPNQLLCVQYILADIVNFQTEILWKDKYGDFVNHLLPFFGNAELTTENPFYKTKIIQNVFPLDVCCWLITEADKLEWKTGLFEPFEKAVNAENIPTVINYLIFASNFWIYNIRDVYGISENIPLKVQNIYICNQENTNEIIENPDGHFLKMVIALNGHFQGGSFYFQDQPENKNVLQRGDSVVYCGLKTIVHEKVGGSRYFLVAIIELEL